MPKPIVSFMGGVRLTEEEAAVGNATLLVSCLGVLWAPVWGIGGLIEFFTGRPVWQVPAAPEPAPSGRGVWALAVASLAVWVPILPFTQAEQRLRLRVEADLRGGRIAEGLDVLSAHPQTDFPPQWDPPPRVGYGETSPDVLEVMDVLSARGCAPWVRACYLDKLRRSLGGEWAFAYNPMRGAELARLARVLRQIPEGAAIAAEHFSGVEARLSDSQLSAEDRENLNALRELAGKGAPGRSRN